MLGGEIEGISTMLVGYRQRDVMLKQPKTAVNISTRSYSTVNGESGHTRQEAQIAAEWCTMLTE